MSVFAVVMLIFISIPTIGQTYLTIGTGTTTVGYPFYTFYHDSRTQMLYTASEITAANGGSGTILSIAFDVSSVATQTMNGFTIQMKNVNQSSMTGFIDAGWTTVYSSNYGITATGWDTITLTTPFSYTGTDLLIQVCFDNTSYTSNSLVYGTAASGMTWHQHVDGGSGCTLTGGNAQPTRPNIKIGISMAPQTNDLAMVSWHSPLTVTAPSATMPISIKFRNAGINTLDTFNLKYSINGGTSYVTEAFNDTIGAGDTLTYTFTTTANMATNGAYSCIAEVINPGDTMLFNNSVSYTAYIGSPLVGTYTIGLDTNDDFSSIPNAITAMSNFGISGPVTFLIDSGTYTGNFTVNSVLGASSVNTITFTSATGNAEDVVILYTPSSSADNYVMKLNAADYFRFVNLTFFNNVTTSTYGKVVELTNGSDYNLFYGNIMKSLVTSSSYAIPLDDFNTNNEFNTYRKNKLYGGYYGARIYGVSNSNWKSGVVFDSNEVSGFGYDGIYAYYLDSAMITNNYIYNGVGANAYAMYISYIFNGSQISNNKINISASGSNYGVYIGSSNYYSYDVGTEAWNIIANNMISLTGTSTATAYGIYSSYNNKVKFLNNSAIITVGSATAGKALYQINTTSNPEGEVYFNNVFVNKGQGYAAHYNTVAKVAGADFNDYYSTSARLTKVGGIDCSTLAAHITALTKDSNSVSINPNFVSNNDLHTMSIPFNNLGTSLADVTTDIDGDIRGIVPDMGADEYTPNTNDVSVISWEAPLNGMDTTSAASVTIKVANFGTASQSNIPVYYKLNNGTAVAGTIAGPLASQDTVAYTFATTANFSASGLNNVKAFTALAGDQAIVNDTFNYQIYVCSDLNGAYTVGNDASDDFSSLQEVKMALTICGIVGPVTFYLDSGLYNGSFTFNNVVGSSATNTITIKGDGDNTVITNTNANAGVQTVLGFNGAKYFIIDSLKVLKDANANYFMGIHFMNACDTITVQNCTVDGGTTTNSLIAGIVASNSNVNTYTFGNTVNHLTLKNNTVLGSYYGIRINGNNSAPYITNISIIDNNVTNFYYYGIYNTYINNLLVENNTVESNSTANGFAYGIYSSYINQESYIRLNKVNIIMGSYGMYLSNMNNNTPYDTLLVYNNSIRVDRSTGGAGYGIYSLSSKYTHFYHNSINITGDYVTSRAIYAISTSTGSKIFNNNLANNAKGYAVYLSSATGMVLNYNNYFTNGAYLGYNSTNKATIADWEASLPADSNSISVNPEYISATDLHTYSIAMANQGTPLAVVANDMDGEVRSTTAPDMGADEYTTPANNLGVVEIFNTTNSWCYDANDTIYAVVKNFGTATQTNVPLHVIGNTGSGSAINLSTTIASIAQLEVDTFMVGTVANSVGAFMYKAYATLATDTIPANDTVIFNGNIHATEAIGYHNDFSTWPLVAWDVQGNGTFSWVESNGAAMVDFWNQTSGNFAELVSPRINLPAGQSAYLGFSYAYNGDYLAFKDSLKVYVSSCGQPWQLIWVKGDTLLTTLGGTSTTAGTFVDQLVQIPVAYQGGDIRVMFKGLSDYGPNLFINDMAVFNAPIANLGSDTAFCDGLTYALSANNYFNASYLWTKGTDTLSQTTDLDIDSSGTYALAITQYTMTVSDTVVVTVNPIPVVSFSGLGLTYCTADAVSTLIGTPAGGTYTGNGIDSVTFDPALAGVGNHVIEYAYTDANGCSSSAFDTTDVYEMPVADMSADAAVCVGDSIMISAGLPVTAPVYSLIFSSYIEGSSNNKAFELYNATSDTLALDSFRIAWATNGGGWASYHTFPVGATLAPNATWVIANNAISPSLYDTALANEVLAYPSVVHYNGDDARGIEASINGVWTLIDVIGEPTVDPGSAWAVAGVANATANKTLKRKASVTHGNTNWAMVAGTDSLSAEYLVYAQDDFTMLGSHSVINGGNNNTYTWSNGFVGAQQYVTPAATTTYYVTVDNGNCAVNDSVTITVNSYPVVDLGVDQIIKWTAGSVTLDAGNAGADSYLWSNGGNTQTQVFDSTNLINASANTIHVTVAKNGCAASDTVVITVMNDVSINELSNNVSVSVYPNPSNGEISLTIAGFTGELNMEVMNIAGQVVASSKIEVKKSFKADFDFSTLAKGVYYIKLSNNDSVKTTKLIIK